MELSLHRKHAGNLVHFHVCMTDSERSHRCRVAEDFIWAGSRPNVVYGFGRSTKAQERGASELHYYCQAPDHLHDFVGLHNVTATR